MRIWVTALVTLCGIALLGFASAGRAGEHNDFPKKFHRRQAIVENTVTAPKNAMVPLEAAMGVAVAPAPETTNVNCEEAAAIVSDYGFANVVARECDGGIYTFLASRKDRHFAIRISARDGEFTEIERLPPHIVPFLPQEGFRSRAAVAIEERSSLKPEL